MKRLLLCLLAMLALAPAARAAEGGFPWDRFPEEKMTDMVALQRGAKLFVNYCLNCHSASYARYNRMRDIGLSEDQIKTNLIFGNEKVGDLMKTSLDPRQAKEWFGAVPPDLTVITRSRSAAGQGTGADYLYTYLRSYYRDDTKATGWNNLAFPNVGMPNPLWELQGMRAAKFSEQTDPHDKAKKVHVFTGYEPISPGTLDAHAFDDTVADLVAYLQWMGEPMQKGRERLGVIVLIFLAFFTIVAWRLNAAFWNSIK